MLTANLPDHEAILEALAIMAQRSDLHNLRGAAGYWVLAPLLFIWRPDPMFQDNSQGAGASNIPPIVPSLPEYQYETVNHTLFGSLTAIRNTIALLHKLNYAEPNDWSKPLPTGRPNELMAILTKRVRVD